MKMLECRKPRPHIWRVAKTPEQREQYYAWAQARAQAHYRGYLWQITFRQWCNIWGEDWSRRGRDSEDLCITRINPDRPWRRNNVELVTRRELRQRSNVRRWLLAKK